MGFLQVFHGEMRWFILLVGAFALVRFGIGIAQGGRYGALETRLWSILGWLIRLQFVLGLVLIIWKGVAVYSGANWTRPILHALTMITALVLYEIFGARVRRASGAAQFQTAFLGVGVTAVLVAIGITLIGGWM